MEGEQREAFGRLGHLLDGRGFLLVFLAAGLAHDGPAFHAVVLLRGDNLVRSAGLF